MNQPLVNNAADEEQTGRAKYKEKHKRERELNDVRWVLSTPQGRRFYWRYLEDCGVFKSSFVGQFQTFFLEGQRNVALKLLADLNDADPNAYVTMLNESKKEQ